MISKEELVEIVNYCNENNVTYKDRIEELGIKRWTFYEAKRRYLENASSDAQGSFIQIGSSGVFSQMPSPASMVRRKPSKTKPSAGTVHSISIELKMPNGAMMRIQGEMDAAFMQSILQTSGGHV